MCGGCRFSSGERREVSLAGNHLVKLLAFTNVNSQADCVGATDPLVASFMYLDILCVCVSDSAHVQVDPTKDLQ